MRQPEMEDESLGREMEVASVAAREAGALLRTAFNRPGGPAGRGGHTEVDGEAELAIRKRLVDAFPSDAFLGEETGYSGGAWAGPGAEPPAGGGRRRCWVVDPNDGTSAFMGGFRGAAVSIALLDEGLPVLGVVFAYNHPDDGGDMIAWARGGPVRRGGAEVLRAWPEAASTDCCVLVSHHADLNPVANARAAAPMRYRALPSIAYRLALVAAGEGDAASSVNGPTSWDVAGGHAILLGAGGDLVDSGGAPVRYTAEGRCPPLGSCFGGPRTLTDHLRRGDWGAVLRVPVKTLWHGQKAHTCDTEAPDGGPGGRVCGLGKFLQGIEARATLSGGAVDAGRLDRAQGCLLGQLAGDSLGSLVEFMGPERIRGLYPSGLRDLADGGVWGTLAGQPTDDSEMALSLARSIVARGGYDPGDAMDAYRRWRASGPFDIGSTTSAGLSGHPNAESQANGALMRVSPLGIFGAGSGPAEVAAWARADAALTHPNPVCGDANALYARAIAEAVYSGLPAGELYRKVAAWAREWKVARAVVDAVEAAAGGPPVDYTHHSGWVITAFRNALWQLLHAPDFETAVSDTVMRGGDTDTNAAICGALLGAVCGRRSLPARWVGRVLCCRPLAGLDGVARPRPPEFWPVDAPALAERLLRLGGPSTGRERT